jgi:putative aldouronate transport system substrate-binding protein
VNKRKLIAPVLVVISAGALIAGCSTDSSKNTKTTAELKVATKVNGKYDPPITITTARGVDSTIKFREGENITSNVHTKWAKEKLGIDLKYLWTVPAEKNGFENKLRLSLAANEPIPDVMTVGNLLLAGELMDSGKIMDITEAYEKYASPRLKKIYSDNPSLWQLVTKNGKKMGLPLTSGGDGGDPVLWIRQDWLDKLKLKAPKTLEELDRKSVV